jgi:hypothetical protein
LPNIKGYAYTSSYTIRGSITGALTNSKNNGASGNQYQNPIVSEDGTNTLGCINFDASNYDPIYSDSISTVQPNSLTVRYLIKAFTTAIVEKGNIDFTQYAQDLANKLTRENAPAFNKLVRIDTSSVWTVPYRGYYKFTLKGGGGGGGGTYSSTTGNGGFLAGGGGGEGGTLIFVKYLEKGINISLTIGAGGTGGPAKTDSTSATDGSSGGNTSITIENSTYSYIAKAGYGGRVITGGSSNSSICNDPDLKYVKIINGCPGNLGQSSSTSGLAWEQRGGTGGGQGGGLTYNANGIDGCGGAGGIAYNMSSYQKPGSKGGDGFVTIEYFDPTL